MKGKFVLIGGALTAAGVLVAFAAPAVAGVIDSPLPVIANGKPTKHVFTVPGVIKNNNLETEFICTSLEKVNSIRIAVEVFASDGTGPINDVTDGSLGGADNGTQTVPVGATVTIGTGNTAGLHEDEEIIGIPVVPIPSLRNGSARILSTSKRIACTVWVMDEVSSPPASMVPLSIISRKQRGD